MKGERKAGIIIIIIIMIMMTVIIITINCNWFVTRWQWLFYMIQNMKLVTNKFKSGRLHEKLGRAACLLLVRLHTYFATVHKSQSVQLFELPKRNFPPLPCEPKHRGSAVYQLVAYTNA